MRTTKLAYLVIAVAGWSLLAAGAVARIGIDVDADSLDARTMANTTSQRVVNLVYDALVQLDVTLTPQPDLALSWESPDPVTWVFHIRQGVVFHDGTPLTAEDIVYTYRTILDPALGARYRTLYTPIARVEALDPYTVQFVLTAPYAPLLSYLDLGIVPKHLAETGEWDLSQKPVGSGPFAFVGWDKGSKITLVRNDRYWGTQPKVEGLEFVLVPDNTARAQALEAGDLDLIQVPLSPSDVVRLQSDPRFITVNVPGLEFTYLNFNTARGPLADPGVRRALSMLVDQVTIARTIYQNTQSPATSILIPSVWGYTEDVTQPKYDPTAAVALLNSLGWTDTNRDGFLDKGGQPLKVILSTHSEDPNRVEIVEYLQYVFTTAGVQASVSITDWPALTAKRASGDYEVFVLGWTSLIDPDRGMYNQLHSKGGTNWGKYSNPDLDALLDAARTTLVLDERIELYQQAAQIIADDVPYYIIAYASYIAIHSNALKNFVPNPRGFLRGLVTAQLAR